MWSKAIRTDVVKKDGPLVDRLAYNIKNYSSYLGIIKSDVLVLISNQNCCILVQQT